MYIQQLTLVSFSPQYPLFLIITNRDSKHMNKLKGNQMVKHKIQESWEMEGNKVGNEVESYLKSCLTSMEITLNLTSH